MPVSHRTSAVTVSKILFATDFCDASQHAASFAQAFAHHFGATVEITHVLNPSVVSRHEQELLGANPTFREWNCESKLRRAQRSFACAGVKTKVLLTQGVSPAKQLVKIARSSGIDLIIAGTQSASSLTGCLGLTADQLIRTAPCPVLTVGPRVRPPKDGRLNFRRILCAIDSSPASAKAVAVALSWAQDSGAKLVGCHVEGSYPDRNSLRRLLSEQSQQALERLLPTASADAFVPEYFCEFSRKDQLLLDLASQVRVDLIVLGASTPNFWLSSLDKSGIRSLLTNASCPVLIVPPAL
jgi:nucleotide-binding universal stress UspA family protein